jgi:hypothetical protein
MDPGPDDGTDRLTPPVRRRWPGTCEGVLLIAAGGALLAACSVASPQAATPSTPGSGASDGASDSASVSSKASSLPEADEPPSAPAEDFAVGNRSEDAIAVAEATEHRVESFSLTQAEAGVTYVVHAACTGEGWMRYRLTVDEREVSASRLRCGRDVVDTAFTAEGGERVQLHLDAPAKKGEDARAEVVPAP